MFSVRFHGRGGQGVVTAAEMLSVAAFRSGQHAQAFPTFGSERTGAPVTSYCRIDDVPIRFHEPIDLPQAVVVQDPTLLHTVPVLAGADLSTYVLVNSSRSPEALDLPGAAALSPARVHTFAATELARAVLGRPLPNTALLGALAALTDVVSIDSVVDAVRLRFDGAVADGNVQAARQAHALVRASLAPGARNEVGSRA